MLATLILGLCDWLGDGVARPAAPVEARLAVPARTRAPGTPTRDGRAQASLPKARAASGDARGEGSGPPLPALEPTTGVVCTLRVVQADAGLDPGIARPVERDLDPQMAVPGSCQSR